ncbi:hypothetical protein [Streptomyces sp. NPDC005953]|uniref:hypothetical protein n=1 Tax=Streptomyces sp. NPDC005953 TaxID=3156719 RepID=UPI0033E3B91C
MARQFFNTDQRRAGGDVLRMFWGQPAVEGQQSAKLHIPIGADIAEMSANLLWSDVPQVTVDRDSTDKAAVKSTQAQIGRYLDDRGHAKLREASEQTAGLSNVYLRVVWDVTLRPRPWWDVIAADAVVPEWRWGALASAIVWRELEPLTKADEVWRLLECHTPGWIEYGVYKGTLDTLGTLMDLTDHPESQGLAERVDSAGRQATGIPRLLISHLPNVLPNRIWSGADAAPLGRSDFAGVEPLMDSLDEAWTSWMRDLRLGVARLAVPQSMLETDGKGSAGRFNLSKELLVGLNLLGEDNLKDSISEIQFKIRVEEHEQTCRALRLQILSSAGYSAQGFGEAGTMAATATEVVARKEESLTTRGTKILYQRPTLIEALTTMMMVDVKHCGAKGVDPSAELTASWPQAVQPDPEATARALSLLESAGAMSTFMKVKTLHPEWDDTEIVAEVRRIREDRSHAFPAGDPFGQGGDGEGDEEGDIDPDAEAEAGADEDLDEDTDKTELRAA